jgi:hypothetical protein
MVSLVFGGEEMVCCLAACEDLALDCCILILEAIQRHRRHRHIVGHRLAMMIVSADT